MSRLKAFNKSSLENAISNLFFLLELKRPLKPTTSAEYNQDHELNRKILAAMRSIRQDRHFGDLVIPGQTHEDFLDI